jgi:Streptomyces sporulation and cell division protein, SsgA
MQAVMSTSPNTVQAAVEFTLVITDGPDRAVRADLSFTPADPYAVRIAFHTGGPADDIVEWTFARSLLNEGLTHAAGTGDVRVWPAQQFGAPRVCLALSSPTGRAVFEAPQRRVMQFLAQTYDLVPYGEESAFVDVEAELAALLNGEF